MTTKQRERKAKALVRLEAQLKSGVKRLSKKTFKRLDEKVHNHNTVPLSDKDKQRIQKEIDVLKSRV